MNWLVASTSLRQQVTRNQVVSSQFLPLRDSLQPVGLSAMETWRSWLWAAGEFAVRLLTSASALTGALSHGKRQEFLDLYTD
jgi:hypothetical protein